MIVSKPALSDPWLRITQYDYQITMVWITWCVAGCLEPTIYIAL